MRIKLFEEFNDKEHEELVVKLCKQAFDKKDVEWIEPVNKKGEIQFNTDFDKKGQFDDTLMFDTGKNSVHIEFECYYDYHAGQRGSYMEPDDPDNVYIVEINVKKVDLYDEDGDDVAHFDRGLPAEAAWTLLFKLMDQEGDRATRGQFEKLLTKLNWKK